MPNLSQLEETLQYTFQDKSLLLQALTHRSVKSLHNERLEFLGDSILSFIMADELYKAYPDMLEGQLSRVRAGLVNGDMLASLARELDLGPYLVLGQGELKTGGQNRDSILADAVEAIIAAIYLDSDIHQVRLSILSFFDKEEFDDLTNSKLGKDPKSALQELLQANKQPLPVYEADITGKAHEQTFHVTCIVEGLSHKTEGKSTNRRKAEQEAAEKYLSLLKGKES